MNRWRVEIIDTHFDGGLANYSYVQLYCDGLPDRRSDLMSPEIAERLADEWYRFYVEGKVPV